MSRTKHSKGKVEGQKLRIQEILNTLNAPSVPFDGTLPPDSRDTVTARISDSGALLACLSRYLTKH